jgi:hypothetical protein
MVTFKISESSTANRMMITILKAAAITGRPEPSESQPIMSKPPDLQQREGADHIERHQHGLPQNRQVAVGAVLQAGQDSLQFLRQGEAAVEHLAQPPVGEAHDHEQDRG